MICAETVDEFKIDLIVEVPFHFILLSSTGQGRGYFSYGSLNNRTVGGFHTGNRICSCSSYGCCLNDQRVVEIGNIQLIIVQRFIGIEYSVIVQIQIDIVIDAIPIKIGRTVTDH